MIYLIDLIFKNGPIWNPETQSTAYPDKKMSGLEHIIINGNVSIEDAMEIHGNIRLAGMSIKENNDPYNKYGANVVFSLIIENKEIRDKIFDYLSTKIKNLSKIYEVDILKIN